MVGRTGDNLLQAHRGRTQELSVCSEVLLMLRCLVSPVIQGDQGTWPTFMTYVIDCSHTLGHNMFNASCPLLGHTYTKYQRAHTGVLGGHTQLRRLQIVQPQTQLCWSTIHSCGGYRCQQSRGKDNDLSMPGRQSRDNSKGSQSRERSTWCATPVPTAVNTCVYINWVGDCIGEITVTSYSRRQHTQGQNMPAQCTATT